MPRLAKLLFFIVLGFNDTTRQPFRVILCRLPEKGREEIEEIVEEMKERRGTGNKEEQEWKGRNRRNKNTPLYPYLLQG